MADRTSGGLDDLDVRDLAEIGTYALALFVAVSLVFYAQLVWLFAFGAVGALSVSWVPWPAVLVVVPAATVAVLPGVVAALISDAYPAWTVWLASAVVVGLTLGLHDLLYGPIYLVG